MHIVVCIYIKVTTTFESGAASKEEKRSAI